jgi:two-component system response regulator AtoC
MPAADPAPGPRLPTVLVADDEKAVRSLLSVVLPRLGYHPLLAADGDEALRLYLEHPPDVRAALLDVLMPGRDGPATLAGLRALSPHLPCAFMTGYAWGYRSEDLLALGADCVIAKPWRLDELGGVLGRLCAGAAAPAGD